VLRNPNDHHKRPVFDPAIRGFTDQVVSSSENRRNLRWAEPARDAVTQGALKGHCRAL
jgi:hypothetical protein